jgi:hypothetical protein
MYMQPDKWADATKHPFGTRQKAICLPTDAATAPYMYLFLGDAMNNSPKRGSDSIIQLAGKTREDATHSRVDHEFIFLL